MIIIRNKLKSRLRPIFLRQLFLLKTRQKLNKNISLMFTRTIAYFGYVNVLGR